MNIDFNVLYKNRRNKLYEWLIDHEVAAVVFQDSEARRESAIRYFTGHPEDAVLILAASGEAVLLPWDINLASQTAHADIIISFTDYKLKMLSALQGVLQKLDIPTDTRIEIPPSTSYPEFLCAVQELKFYNVRCNEGGGAHQAVTELRSVKDSYEISCIRQAAAITDELIDLLEKESKSGGIKTEIDAALLIERECRNRGCEGAAFSILAAGPERSFGIHCFPSYTKGAFPGEGMSILDFGVTWQGYRSDVTVTFLKGKLSEKQEKQIALVEKAYAEALKLYKKDTPVFAPAKKAAEIFAKEKRKMPHGLGHGIGLETHEAPLVRQTTEPDKLFKSGMTVTLEPGLYDPELGGCRWENDILITETGNEILTHSRIIRL
ncbi:MAG: Xaa-Pro peptidase family protein [Treponema sp.]|jgi:Xaa-Pro dipeptidase|nr:Xaa-Pro peptidase family protein [Treponema sp.]